MCTIQPDEAHALEQCRWRLGFVLCHSQCRTVSCDHALIITSSINVIISDNAESGLLSSLCLKSADELRKYTQAHMQRLSRSKGGHTTDGFTKQLAEEAAAMEARLAQLKVTMLQEKAKREAVVADTSSCGSIWSNGGTGPLKPKGPIKTSQGQQARPNKPHGSAAGMQPAKHQTALPSAAAAAGAPAVRQPSSRSGVASCRPSAAAAFAPKPPTVTVPRLPSRTSSSRGSSRDGSGSASKAVTSTTNIHICNEPSGDTGARCSTGSLLQGTYDEAANRDSFQQAVMAWRNASTTNSNSTVGSTSHSTGISCGGDNTGSLLCGTYDEAANRNSFQEALREWRQGGATSSRSSSNQAAARPEQAELDCQQTHGKQAETAAIITQTDTSTANSISSGNRHLNQSSSRVRCAGSGNSYLLKMLAGSRSNTNDVGAGITACNDSSSRASSAHNNNNAEQLTPLEQHDHQQDMMATQLSNSIQPSEQGTRLADSMVVRGSSSNGTNGSLADMAVQLVREGCMHTKTSSEAQCTDAEQGVMAEVKAFAFDDWMASLHAVEQAAADLAATATSSEGAALAVAEAGTMAAETATQAAPTIHAAASAVQPSHYQKQVQQVLKQLEQLEQLHEAEICSSGGIALDCQSVATAAVAVLNTANQVSADSMRLPDAVELPEMY